MTNIGAMTKTLIEQIEAYSAASGLKPSSICVKATGNSRLYERLKRITEQHVKYERQIALFIRKNPAEKARIVPN